MTTTRGAGLQPSWISWSQRWRIRPSVDGCRIVPQCFAHGEAHLWGTSGHMSGERSASTRASALLKCQLWVKRLWSMEVRCKNRIMKVATVKRQTQHEHRAAFSNCCCLEAVDCWGCAAKFTLFTFKCCLDGLNLVCNYSDISRKCQQHYLWAILFGFSWSHSPLFWCPQNTIQDNELDKIWMVIVIKSDNQWVWNYDDDDVCS